MLMPIRPPHLSPGDTLGLVAPASAPADPRILDQAADVLGQLGFKVKLARNVHKRHGYLAGTDRERAGDLMQMFTDRGVQGILCVRGGYGTARLLPKLDYHSIRKHAKVFVGYSDVTSLHCAFLTKANLISFHGPMLHPDFLRTAPSKFTRQSFLRLLTGRSEMPARPHGRSTALPIPNRASRNLGGIVRGYRRRTVEILRGGVARGQLVGGNLSILCTTIGTPWEPPLRGRILFLEELGESPYRFDRMLTYLLNCGRLQRVAGIAVGLNADSEDPRARRSRDYHQSLHEVLRERLRALNVPVVTGLPFGHVRENATLPVGARVTLDARRGDLLIDEPVVS